MLSFPFMARPKPQLLPLPHTECLDFEYKMAFYGKAETHDQISLSRTLHTECLDFESKMAETHDQSILPTRERAELAELILNPSFLPHTRPYRMFIDFKSRLDLDKEKLCLVMIYVRIESVLHCGQMGIAHDC